MRVAVLDLETDPFEHGQMVHPFLAGFYDGSRLISHWSKDCVAQLVSSLNQEPEPWCIYAHNGGRFDFYYFLDFLSSLEMRIINGRIVQARLGKHELRDSYAIMPFPLADYDKDQIDYELMRAGRREKHRDEIMRYFRKDLTSLYELVSAFHKEFGDKLTIGSTSMGELKKRHEYQTGNEVYDTKFRARFYFGGRNQVFEPGITKGDIKIYDVNSMYPYVMRDYLHPISVTHDVSRSIEKNTCFVVATGRNYGAFPVRRKDNSLDFNQPTGEFCCSIHEWNAALHTGSFKPLRVIKTYCWRERGTFDDFVTHFYDARQAAKIADDKIRAIFYKYVLNSAYGKFAQNPNNYFDWFLTKYGELPKEWHECTKTCENPCNMVWTPAYIHDGEYMIWQRPLQQKFWFNVATGASITGASRAVLLLGIAAAPRPLYCDTDSIISDGPANVEIDNLRLGAWKLEGSGSMAAIAGKKMYAIFDAAGTCIKKAHKGARLTGQQILHVTKGGEIESANPVPAFRWDGSYTFTKRTIRATHGGVNR